MEKKPSFEIAKQALKRQKEIREKKPEIRGREKKFVPDLIKLGKDLLEELIKTPQGRENERRITKLAKELEIKEEDLKASFLKGLDYNIKAAIKLGYLIPEVEFLEQKRILESIITGYTLNFRATLNSLKRRREKGIEIYPKTALEIASHVYILSPRVLDELKKEFPQVDKWIIKHTATHYPSEPEKFIEETLERIEELAELYPSIPPAKIKKTAVYYPDKYLEKAKQYLEGKLKRESEEIPPEE